MRNIGSCLMTKQERKICEEGKASDDMRSEYRQDEMGKGVRGKYYSAYKAAQNIVLPDPEMTNTNPGTEAVDEAD